MLLVLSLLSICYLEMGLQNFEEYQVCAITVGVVGDICRALEAKIFPLVL